MKSTGTDADHRAGHELSGGVPHAEAHTPGPEDLGRWIHDAELQVALPDRIRRRRAHSLTPHGQPYCSALEQREVVGDPVPQGRWSPELRSDDPRAVLRPGER